MSTRHTCGSLLTSPRSSPLLSLFPALSRSHSISVGPLACLLAWHLEKNVSLLQATHARLLLQAQPSPLLLCSLQQRNDGSLASAPSITAKQLCVRLRAADWNNSAPDGGN